MAKKEKTQKEQKEKKQKGKAGANVPPPSGAPSAPVADKGKKKDKKDKKAKKGEKTINDANIDRSQLTADQMTQAQIEEAIKESQDPSSKLKKLRSPLSVRGCLLNLLILIVLTVAIVILCCYLMLDHDTFNLWVVIKDIFNKFRITEFFQKVAAWFKKIFT